MSKNSKLDNKDLQLSAEYALGVLSAKDRSHVESRMVSDAELRSEVAGWEAQLAPMLEEVDEVPPPARVWQAIENRVAPQEQLHSPVPGGASIWKWLTGLTSTAAVACFGLMVYVSGGDFTGAKFAALQDQYNEVQAEADSLRQSLEVAKSEGEETSSKLLETLQEVTTLTTSLEQARQEVIASGDALMVAQRQVAELETNLQNAETATTDAQAELASAKQELESMEGILVQAQAQLENLNAQINEARPLVASLTSDGELPAFVAQYDPLKKSLHIQTRIEDTDELVPEIWFIPGPGEREGEVLSLGVMSETEPDTVMIAQNLQPLIGNGGTLAITMEQAGGSPTGVATSPIIAIGELQSF